jgi:hypothetical protein
MSMTMTKGMKFRPQLLPVQNRPSVRRTLGRSSSWEHLPMRFLGRGHVLGRLTPRRKSIHKLNTSISWGVVPSELLQLRNTLISGNHTSLCQRKKCKACRYAGFCAFELPQTGLSFIWATSHLNGSVLPTRRLSGPRHHRLFGIAARRDCSFHPHLNGSSL